MTTPIEEFKVTKDPRGTFPRTVTYTVDPIEGEDVFTVMLLPVEGAVCMVHGDKCDHAKAVKLFIETKGKMKRP
jgi:hypothetical protein